MKKTLRFVSMLALMLVSAVGTKAQNGNYNATIDQAFQTNWTNTPIGFDMADLVSFFGTDTATFAADLKAFIAADAADFKTADNSAKTMYLQNIVNGGEFVYPNADQSYSADNNGFWMSDDAKALNYGSEGYSWYAFPDYETGENVDGKFYICVGQLPNHFVDGATLSCHYVLNYKGKQANFYVTVKVAKKPVADLPEPVTDLTKLTIVKDYTLTLPFVVGKSYKGKTYSATLDGIYDALGVTAETFDEFVADYVYTQVVKSDTTKLDPDNKETWTVKYSLTDNQLQKPEAASGGAWYGRYGNTVGDTEQIEYLPINAPMTWGAGFNTFYTQSITLAEGVYSIISGQYPDKLKVGDTDYAYHYIIVGDKAARVKIQVEVKEPETIDPDAMVKVGEATVNVTAQAQNSYATKNFSVDIDAIVAALGCTKDDLEDFYAYDQNDGISDNHTTSGGGYYVNEDGRIDTWGNKAPVYIDPVSIPDGTFAIGQYAGIYKDITENKVVTVPIIFQYLQNFYVVNVVYTITPVKAGPDTEMERVATAELAMYIVPSATTYPWDKQSTLDLEWIASKIGTDDFTLYTDKYKAGTDGAEGKLNFSNSYTCDPNPGFWYGTTTYEDSEHRVVVDNAGWGTNSFGLSYAGGVITWYQYPGQRSIGDVFYANLYCVNEETGKYVQYYLTVEYVETPPVELTKVGEEDVIVVLSDDNLNDDGWFVDNDLAKALEALGMDASEYDSGEWYAQTGSGVNKKVDVFESSNCQFDASGKYTTNPDDFLFAVAYDAGKKYFYVADYTAEWDDETLVSTRVGFANPGAETPGIYIFNVHVCGSKAKAEEVLGISGLSAEKRINTNVYDLSGRIVSRGVNLNALQRGTYIINNKKVVIK